MGDTKLSPEEEAAFQRDMRQGDGYRQWFEQFGQLYGGPPNLDDPEYDYRSAWKAGIRPAPYKHDQNRYHWASSLPDGQMLKGENHPTAWMEHFMRETGIDPNELGLSSKADADAYLAKGGQMGPYDVQIGEAKIVDPWEISIGDASLFPEQEAGAVELPDPWQVSIGDAQMDPSVAVNIGMPDILGPNEFMLDDGTKANWDFGPIDIKDPWK